MFFCLPLLQKILEVVNDAVIDTGASTRVVYLTAATIALAPPVCACLTCLPA